MSDHAFKPLALQMSHVVVQLGGQRLQRPTTRSADHDLPHEIFGQPIGKRRSREPQDFCRRPAHAGQAGVIQNSYLSGDARLQRLQYRRVPR